MARDTVFSHCSTVEERTQINVGMYDPKMTFNTNENS